MATHTQSEIERKYDVAAEAVLPDLVGAGPVARATAEPAVLLEATYLDTADDALARARITLRRRSGGADEGWHAKLPGVSARTEIHAPLTATTTVPAALRAPLLGQVGHEPLEPIATLRTERSITRLFDDSGRELAEVADDLVSATDLRTGLERRWREWEVEIVDAPADAVDALLDAVESRLAEADAVPSASASKLARATGRSTARSEEPTPADAGAAALAALRALLAELRIADLAVRLDGEDAVHRMRVLVRRLRSVLAGARPVIGRDATDPLRAELRRLGSVLGEARDAEVGRERIRAALAAGTGEGAGGASLIAELDRRYVRGYRRVLEALSDERYLHLLAGLDALIAEPALTEAAAGSPQSLVRASLAHEIRRVRRAKKAAARSADPDARHAVRKAAKRLRYVAEAWSAVVPDAVGKHGRRLARAAEAVADTLGEERDARAAQVLLRGAADRAERVREHGFDLGVAWSEEGMRAEAASGRAEKALARLARRAGRL